MAQTTDEKGEANEANPADDGQACGIVGYTAYRRQSPIVELLNECAAGDPRRRWC
jgi:hypothetical protein